MTKIANLNALSVVRVVDDDLITLTVLGLLLDPAQRWEVEVAIVHDIEEALLVHVLPSLSAPKTSPIYAHIERLTLFPILFKSG